MDDAPVRYALRGSHHLQLFGDKDLYCESSHGPDDVLYSGSEDDYYDSPATRKLRYEAEARRFLRDRAPVLLSTTLTGPFSKESGWKNPWKGKGAGRHAPQPEAVNGSEPELEHSLPRSQLPREIASGMRDDVLLPKSPAPDTPSSLRAQLSDIHDLTQSVLPSPPVSNNPYMDDDSLARVQSWRADVESNAAKKDEFWLPTRQSDSVQHSKKRQASEEWLRRKSLKRRKPEVIGSSSANSPSQAALQKRRQQQFWSVSSSHALTPNPASSAADASTANRSFGLESWVTDDLTASQTRLSSRSGRPSLPSLQPNSGRQQSVLRGLPIAKTTQLLDNSRLSAKANSAHSQPNHPNWSMGSGACSQSSPSLTGPRALASEGDVPKPRQGPNRAKTGRRRLESKPIRLERHSRWNPPTASREEDDDSPVDSEISNQIQLQLESQQDSSFCYHIKARPRDNSVSTAEDDLHGQEPIETSAADAPSSLAKNSDTNHDAILEGRGYQARDDCEDSMGIDGPTIACIDSPIPSQYSVVKHHHSDGRDVGHEEYISSDGKNEVPRTLAEAKTISTDTMTSSREDPTPTSGNMVLEQDAIVKDVQALDPPSVRNICENEADIPVSAVAEENIEGDTTLISSSKDIPQTYAEVKDTGDTTHTTIPMETDQADDEATQDSTRAQWPLPGELQREREVSPSVVSRSSSLSELPSELVHELEGMNELKALDHEPAPNDERLRDGVASSPRGKMPAAEESESPRISTQCQSPWARVDVDSAPVPNADSACAVDDSQVSNPLDRNGLAGNQSPVSQGPWSKGDGVYAAGSPPSGHLPPVPEGIQGFYRRGSRTGSSAQQSPWLRRDETTAPSSRRQNTSPYSPLSILDDILPSPTTPSMPEGHSATALDPIRPSTPEMKPSSLPTPDFTFSIRSLRRFMSPSPESSPRPTCRTHRHLKPALSSSRTKATTRQHGPARRVRFVSLPGNDDFDKENNDPGRILLDGDNSLVDDDDDYIENGLTKRRVPRVVTSAQPRRAASPPPKSSVTDLPSEVEKFREHYAAVAGRHRNTARAPVRLLPSDSQLASGSPAVGAMAERFLEADAQAAKVVEPLAADDAEQGGSSSSSSGNVGILDAERDETPPLDDVAAVLQNLDDFLGSCWDVEEEVAKARDSGQDRVRVALEANVWI